MTDNSVDRRAAFRTAIEGFLKERLDGKLEKLKPDDSRRDELVSGHIGTGGSSFTAAYAAQKFLRERHDTRS